MKELAEHIIYVAHKNKKSITNLQLQKILYFTLRYSVPEIGLRAAIKTYDEPFLTTRYGPLIKSQYQRFMGYGSSPIIGDASQHEEYNALKRRLINLLFLFLFYNIKCKSFYNIKLKFNKRKESCFKG